MKLPEYIRNPAGSIVAIVGLISVVWGFYPLFFPREFVLHQLQSEPSMLRIMGLCMVVGGASCFVAFLVIIGKYKYDDD